mmetsp:Transcript_48247/g.139778  ORF Transcript_48247/g.139778 Transcript_48247/m.139778 type:complete len:190 (+) Transcript_48247:100-669(+)
MVLPFEVRPTCEEVYLCMLALKKAPGAHGLYSHFRMRVLIASLLPGRRFRDLSEAVLSALDAGRCEVRLLRNVTLPPAAERRFKPMVWCVIPAGASVTLTSSARKWRLRHACSGASCLHSLFVLNAGARLRLRSLDFEATIDSGHQRYLAVVGKGAEAGQVELEDVDAVGYNYLVHHESPGAWNQWNGT